MPEFIVEQLGHQGDGVIAFEGRQLFAPFVLPGEKIKAHLSDERLTDIRIVEPSSERVKPVCRHFKSCGGCAIQHASEQVQQVWRRDQIESSLAQNGIHKTVDALHVSPPASRRRATFVGRRTKTGGVICFHRSASHELIDLEECAVLRPEISKRFGVLRSIADIGASRRQNISIQVTAALNGLDVAVSGAKDLSQSEIQDLAKLNGLARMVWNGELLFQSETPFISLGDAKVPVPAGSFLQATEEAAQEMGRFAKSHLNGAKRIADLFAGSGTLGLALAGQAQIHAFESEGPALEALKSGWANSTGLKHIEPVKRDLFRNPLLVGELKPFDAVVLDPPRAGAMAQIAEIAQSNIKRVVYVSCNPASYARDVRVLMDAGFEIQRLEGIDQFRWSKHIELQSYLTR